MKRNRLPKDQCHGINISSLAKLLIHENQMLQRKKKSSQKIRKKTYRIKTNNQEELIRKQNESDATS
jgi:hypothetical protein